MLGFAIKYKGVLLDLEDDAHLTVEWYSTLFNESELFRGSYSYAVGLKLTDKNKAILGLPHLLENRASRKSVPVSILLFGHTWKNAVLDFSIKGNTLSGNLLIDNAIIADSLQNLTLPDLFSYYNGTEKAYTGLSIGLTNPAKLNYMNLCATQPAGSTPMVWPIFRNYGWSGTFMPEDGRTLINQYNWEGLTYNLVDSVFFHCPMFYLHWLVEQICTKLGFKAQGSFMDDPEIKRWVIFNNGYYTGHEIMQLGFEVYPSRHLPNISVGAFFKALRNDMKLGIYFDSLTKIATFELPDVLLTESSFIDVGDMVVKDSLDIKSNTQKSYVIKAAKDEADQVNTYFDYIASLRIGNDEKSTAVELSIGAPRMNNPLLVGVGLRTLRCAIVDQVANVYDSEYVETESFNATGEINKNAFGFRLLSWRGLQDYSVEQPTWKIPYGTSDNKNSKGLEEVGYRATDPFNVQGWLRKGCESYYRMLQAMEDVQYDMYMPVDRFSELYPLAKSRIRGRSGGLMTVFFDRITFEPNKRNSLLFARMKGYSLSAAYALMGTDMNFVINEQVKVPDVIYVSAQIEWTRTETSGSTGTTFFGKILLEFWTDKYRQSRKVVSGLIVDFRLERYIKNSSGESTLVFERTVTTGTNVTQHLTTEEFAYFNNGTGGSFTSKVFVLANDANKYVPIE